MQSAKNSSKVIAIALLLLAAYVAPISMPVQQAEAQNEIQVVTHAYLSFRPNPVGVNQQILVNVWTTPAVDLYRYQTGYTVTITKPDGTTEVFHPTPYRGDSTSWFEYTVDDQVGTWKLKFDYAGVHFPAETVPSSTASNGTLLANYYLPVSTEEQELTVQSNPVLSWPPSPLPTDYWARPVSPENREWWIIAGNYPSTGVVGGGPDWPANTNTYMGNYAFTPYVQGPNSAHVVWKRQGAISGLVGGVSGIGSINSGGGTPSIIYAGRCYQSLTKVIDGVPTSVWECYDLRTGEVYWDRTGIGNQAPTLISYKSSGQTASEGLGGEGIGPSVSLLYIGGGRLIKYDPWTGAVSLNVTTSTAFTYTNFYSDPYCWGTQKIGSQTYLINWTTAGTATNFNQRIISNITFANPVPSSSLYSPIRQADYEAGIGVYIGFEPNDQVGAWYGFNMSAASLITGELLWKETISGDTESVYAPAGLCADHGKVAILSMDRYYACYSLYDGKLLWRSDKAAYPWAFGWAYATASAYGLLYGMSYAGVYAFDWNTGKIVWYYEAPTPYEYETPYVDENGKGVYSFDAACVIADGKLYTCNIEHTPTEPITRGWRLHCINATSGEGIWNITGPMSVGGIADGYLIASNSYDGYMYVIGKGKSATTVSAPDVSVPLGTAFTIKGTVLDMSPAQPGTPCVSKNSMTTEMEYLHMQHPIDGISHNETITGVPVSLTAIASDGTVYDLGSVTTNGYYGTFSMSWTPPSEGKYEIIASFASDDSYGSSAAATAVTVGPAPEPYPQPVETVTPPDTIPYIVGMGIAIIIAVAIAVLLLRKR
jgi:outer membrane protein assembly factor BamB